MDEYNQKFQRVTQTEDAKKVERQQAFQDVFAADMDHYRTHGKVTGKRRIRFFFLIILNSPW